MSRIPSELPSGNQYVNSLTLVRIVFESSLFPFLLLVKIFCSNFNIPNPCSSLDPHPHILPTTHSLHTLYPPWPSLFGVLLYLLLELSCLLFYHLLKVALFWVTPSSPSFIFISVPLLTNMVLRWLRTRLGTVFLMYSL